MRLRTVLIAAALALAGCVSVPPEPAPPPAPPAARQPETPKPSALSAEALAHYAQIERNLRARGLMRTDGGGADTPFGTRQVVETFMEVAFYAEYAERQGRLVAEPTSSKLQRWERPVNFRLEWGDSVAPADRARDRSRVSALVGRMERATGHPMSVTSGPGNFTVLFLSEDERRAHTPRLRQLMPGLSAAATSAIINMPTSVYCLVVARDGGGSGAYVQAVAVIRAEHPPLMRLSCIHEELAQGLGLANDSPRARPSIFNDDEEFALLTRLDEILLKILYDRRLKPGMTEAEARPIVEVIAAEVMGGAS